MRTGQVSRHARVDIVESGAATITITEAGSLNILGTPAILELTRAIDGIAGTPEVRVLVLRGSGDKGFVGGADIREMAGLERASAERFIAGLRDLCESVRRCPVPVIARLPGWCLGGGLELAMSCDIRIAADDARFGMPEVEIGIPSIIHAALLPRLVGQGRAAWMLLTGEIVEAQDALNWGLVDKVVAPPQLDSEVDRVASLLAGFGPEVLRQQKRLLREWEHDPLETSIDRGVAEFGRAFDTGEPQRFMRTFLSRKG